MIRALLAAGLALAAVTIAATPVAAGEPAAGSLQDRIDAASPGDRLYVDGGVFHEHIVIDKPLSLIGQNEPVIDGDGEGSVVSVAADDVSFSGFLVRGSGRSISQEPAAIKVDEVDRASIRGNRVEDSYSGIHVLGSEASAVRFNEIDLGGDVEIGRRGHGIYLWEATDTVVHGNAITNVSDGIHLEFSEGTGIGENTVSSSRYALHFMYSDGNKMVGNTFRDNLAGAVLMFSHDLLLKDNELSSNRRGATGVGILLKDVDNIFVEGNRVLRNKFGMTVEGTPQEVGATAVFMRNLFALNDTGIGVMSNSPITFVENAMIDNGVQVKAMGGELASRVLAGHGGGSGQADLLLREEAPTPPKGAVWTSLEGRGNYWSDYRGYDADGDGAGDRPYLPEPPFAGRLDDDDALRLFQFTLAQQAIDAAADMFPLYEYEPVIEDSAPLMSPPEGTALATDSAVNGDLMVASAMLIAISIGAAGLLGVDFGRLPGGALAPWRKRPTGAHETG